MKISIGNLSGKGWAVLLCVLSLIILAGLTGVGITAEGGKKLPYDKQEPYTIKTPSPGFTDGGSDEMYDPGVDLVVSKVAMKRGIFQGEQKIQIIPSVKNKWHGSTSARIKILLDGLALAEWIGGGIGPNEEKQGGALYVPDSTGRRSLRFSVEVDDGNAIPENNDHNNRCENVTFSSTDVKKIHTCPIVGPHEPLI